MCKDPQDLVRRIQESVKQTSGIEVHQLNPTPEQFECSHPVIDKKIREQLRRGLAEFDMI